MKNFKLIGIAANFILGKLGPRVKGSTNKIEFRNNDDTDFVEIQAKAPTTDNGLATKKFVQDEIASMAAPDLSAYETIVNVDSKDAQVLSDANDYTDNAKQGLQSQINNIVSNVDPASLDSLTEIVEAFQEADNNLNNAITNLAQAASSGLNQEILDRQTADAQVLSDANDYTDQQVSSIAIPDLTPYETIANVDSKDAQVLIDANAYTDQEIANVGTPDLSAYETIVNVDAKDAQVLIDANAYTDQELSNVNLTLNDHENRITDLENSSGGGGGGASVTGMEVIFAHATQFSYTVLSGQLNSFLNFVDSSEIYEGTTQVLAGSRNHIVLPSGGGVYEFEITYRFNPVDQAGFTSSIPTLINLYTQNFTEFFEDSSRPILSLIDFITGEEDKVYRRQFKVSADATHLYIGITRAQNVTYKSINVSLKKISEIGGGDAPDLSAYETIVNVDAKDAQVLVDANAYTDQEIANVSTPDLSAYETIVNVDTKDAAVLQAAKDYTDANSGGGSGVVQALSGAVVSLIGNSTSWQASLGSLVTIQVPIGAKAVVFEVVSDNNANFSSIAVANTTASPAWRKGYLSSNYNLNGGGFTTSTGILELSGYVAANGLINFPKSYKFCIPNPTAGTYQYYLSAAASGAGTFIRIDYFRILASVVM